MFGAPPTAIWLWKSDSNPYYDQTYRLSRRGDYLQPADGNAGLGAVSDELYIGYESRFDAIMFWLSETGIRGSGGYVWEAAIGGSSPHWERVVPIQEYPFHFEDLFGYVLLDLRDPRLASWGAVDLSELPAPEVLTPTLGDRAISLPDSRERYWIKVTLSPDGGAVRRPELEAVAVRPYISVATVLDVEDQLQVAESFDSSTRPSINTVETYLRGAEDSLARVTGHSYRPEFVENELLNFRAYGLALRHRPILDVLKLEVWSGDDWDQRTIGRDDEWHYEPQTGMIYVSSLFLGVVPPTLRRGYSERRNQGAYKRGVRVSYVYGEDPRVDPFASEVGRIVVKQACIDISIDRDFNMLLPTNLDRVSLESKIRTWREEVTEFKDRYAKLVMW